jgi:hypothetical protein
LPHADAGKTGAGQRNGGRLGDGRGVREGDTIEAAEVRGRPYIRQVIEAGRKVKEEVKIIREVASEKRAGNVESKLRSRKAFL